MSNQPGRRDRKKAQTRQLISDIATRLFIERGFENVSVDEIAQEAQVARKTVFNYFPRKEDLVFDREEEARAMVRHALVHRGARSPVHAFQVLMRSLVEQRHRLFRIDRRPLRYWRMVAESPALTARARELQVAFGNDLAEMLADAAGTPHGDPHARLAAAMLMDTLVVAYGAAMRAYRGKRAPEVALLEVMERGFAGVEAALAGTVYV
jgi:AcrR family transcriptional regulator